jgi:diguanylate cyclase (GGDEF)-like protein/PAS domain S-box-containing protein
VEGVDTIRTKVTGNRAWSGGGDVVLGLSRVTEGWGWLGLLRLGLAAAMAVYAVTYHPQPSRHVPAALPELALLLAAVPAVFGAIQVLPRFRHSTAFAMAAVPPDAAAVLATLALYAFDPRRYVLALVVVVQAEAGVVLGLRWGLAAWAAISAAYVAVEVLSSQETGVSALPAEVGIRIGIGLIITLAGAYMSKELSGERRRRALEQEQTMRSLQEAEARFRSLVERNPVVTYTQAGDESGRIVYVSPQLETLTGYRPEDWMGRPEAMHEAIDPEDRDRVLALRRRALSSGDAVRQEYRLLTPDGRTVWVRDEATPVGGERGRPRFWQGVIVDITDRKLAEEKVAYLAYHDALTGLPNRTLFEELVSAAVARASRSGGVVAVLYLDLDRFKEVNDTLGHNAGDEVLRQVAERLRSTIRAADSLARRGGDEFLVLLSDLHGQTDEGGQPVAPVDHALGVADRIHRELAAPFVVSDHEFRVTTSVGASLFPLTAADGMEMIEQADAAMYESKRLGSGKTVVYGDAASGVGE